MALDRPGTTARRLGTAAAIALSLLAAGCNRPLWAASQPAADAPLHPDDVTIFKSTADSPGGSLRPPRSSLVMAVLHVEVPQAAAAQMNRVWATLREEILPADALVRLRENGLRVAVGHEKFWSEIKAAMEAIPGCRVTAATPLRVPAGFPLSLELDAEPRDQTLFCIERDGNLDGGTYNESRNVLRVAYVQDASRPERIVFQAVPEVHQKSEGLRWVRTESGLWQVPRQETHAFAAAGFSITLEPGEFVLVAPSDRNHIQGLLGREFFTRETDGLRYQSFVFLRPDVENVAPGS
jgi:hypothetical protein